MREDPALSIAVLNREIGTGISEDSERVFSYASRGGKQVSYFRVPIFDRGTGSKPRDGARGV